MPVEEAPIEPAHLVVLAIGIAVAPLSATHFVAHLEHRRTDRCEQDYDEVLYLTAAQLLDGSVLGRPLDPAVPRQVRSRAVPVSFAIRLVVLVVVGNQIVQREAVMAGHEIDALFGFSFLVAENVGAAERPLRQQPDRPAVAFDKAADVVPEATVPLLPAIADRSFPPDRDRQRPTPQRSVWCRRGRDPNRYPREPGDFRAADRFRPGTGSKRGRNGTHRRACASTQYRRLSRIMRRTIG